MGGNVPAPFKLASTPPVGFNWPFTTYPVTIYKAGRLVSYEIDARSFIPAAVWSGPTYFVDPVNGVDSTGTGAVSAPWKTLAKAVNTANAGGAACKVMVKAATFTRGNGFLSAVPTVDIAFIGYGGRVVVHNADDLSWAVDATQTNTYSTTRSNVLRAFDTKTPNAFGDYTELTQVATPALCNTTPGSWAQSGSTLYVRRADGAPVTNANTRAYLIADTCVVGQKSVYVSGIDFEGGQFGAFVAIVSGPTRNIVAENCSFKYAGGSPVANQYDGVRLADFFGLGLFIDCVFAANTKDGFNVHWNRVNTSSLYPITINCVGRDNGRYTSTSNNGYTLHESVVGMDIGGYYFSNSGGNVRNIGSSQMWAVGTISEADKGDLAMGGGIAGTGFSIGETGVMWLEETMTRGNLVSLTVESSQAKIFTRNHRTLDGSAVNNGGVLAQF